MRTSPLQGGCGIMGAGRARPKSGAGGQAGDGEWTEYFTGRVIEGGLWYGGDDEYFSLPLFVGLELNRNPDIV